MALLQSLALTARNLTLVMDGQVVDPSTVTIERFTDGSAPPPTMYDIQVQARALTADEVAALVGSGSGSDSDEAGGGSDEAGSGSGSDEAGSGSGSDEAGSGSGSCNDDGTATSSVIRASALYAHLVAREGVGLVDAGPAVWPTKNGDGVTVVEDARFGAVAWIPQSHVMVGGGFPSGSFTKTAWVAWSDWTDGAAVSGAHIFSGLADIVASVGDPLHLLWVAPSGEGVQAVFGRTSSRQLPLNAANSLVYSPTPSAADGWVHYAVVYDADAPSATGYGVVALYVNGALVASCEASEPNLGYTAPKTPAALTNFVGSNPEIVVRSRFSGRLHDVRVYSAALTAAEVAAVASAADQAAVAAAAAAATAAAGGGIVRSSDLSMRILANAFTVSDVAGRRPTVLGSGVRQVPDARFGTVASLDRSYIRVGGGFPRDSFTKTAWVAWEGGAPGEGAHIFSGLWERYLYVRDPQHLLWVTGGALSASFGRTTNGDQLERNDTNVLSAALPDDPAGWTHIAFVYDAAAPSATGHGTMQLFVNGALVASRDAAAANPGYSGPYIEHTATNFIGGSPDVVPTQTFQGRVHDVRLYAAALSSAEVQQIAKGADLPSADEEAGCGSGSGTDEGSGTGSGTDEGSGSGTDEGSGSGTDEGSGTGSGTDEGSGSGTDEGSGSGTDEGSGSGTDEGSGTGSGGGLLLRMDAAVPPGARGGVRIAASASVPPHADAALVYRFQPDGALTLGVPDLTGSYTKALWVKRARGAGHNFIHLLEGGRGDGGLHRLWTGGSGDTLVMHGDTMIAAPQLEALTEDAWVHLAAVYDADSGALALYINGEGVAHGSTAARVVPGTLVLGRDDGAPANLDGDVYDVRIYGRALSPEEVAAVYAGADVSA